MADPRPILDLIALHESDGAVRAQGVASAYDVVWGGIPAAHRPQALLGQPLTGLTVAQVLEWQRDVVRRGSFSSAAGRYQFIRSTLEETVAQEGIARSEPFAAAVQDRLALRLLRRRGWERLTAGQLDRVAFAEQLAREWASLPVHADQQGQSRRVTRGQSYYAGDGHNRASATPEAVLAAIGIAVLAVPEAAANLIQAPPPPAAPRDPLEARVAALEARLDAMAAALTTGNR